jgi:hypothetical protein
MGLSGPFLASPRFGNTVFLPHGPGHGAANPAKTVLAGGHFGETFGFRWSLLQVRQLSGNLRLQNHR